MISVLYRSATPWRKGLGLFALGLGLLSGCGSSGALKPAKLPPDTGRLQVTPAWTAQIGEVHLPLDVHLVEGRLALSDSEGQVLVLEADTGRSQWRLDLGQSLAAGVGYDGRRLAVVTQENELVVLEASRVIWRERLSARSLTPPLVAGERVFVLAQDRSISAYDGASGQRLWRQQRLGETLVLGRSGVLLPLGNTLVAGLGGRLLGLDPNNGALRWEAPIATPRGTNDVERLVDLVAQASRHRSVVCVRAYQAAVGCVDGTDGRLLWTRPARGHLGLDGDERQIYGVETDGTLLAWGRRDGEPGWRFDALRYRRLSQALVAPDYLVVGDEKGRLHFLSRADGTTLARVETDGSPLAAPLLRAGQILVAVTVKGAVYGLRLP